MAVVYPRKRALLAVIGILFCCAVAFRSLQLHNSGGGMRRGVSALSRQLPTSPCAVEIHATWMSRFTNFGDLLVPMILSRLTGCRVVKYSAKLGHKYMLMSIGSSNAWPSEAIVWGSGIMDRLAPLQLSHPNAIRSVRGPRTRAAIRAQNISCPEIYGDIALVLPFLFPELKPNPSREYIVTPHIRDEPLYRQRNISNIVSVARQPMEAIADILTAKKVISSSLHGIITAEAFGIPAVLVFTGEDKRSIIKYYDYYEGTGRFTFPIATTVEEALTLEPPPPPIFDAQKVLAAFPFELYNLTNPYA